MDVRLERLQGGAIGRCGEVRRGPQVFLVGSHPLALSQPAGGDACEGVYKPRDGNLGWVAHEQMDMVVLAIHLDQFCAKVAHTLVNTSWSVQVLAVQHSAPILGYEDKCTLSAETTCLPRR